MVGGSLWNLFTEIATFSSFARKERLLYSTFESSFVTIVLDKVRKNYANRGVIVRTCDGARIFKSEFNCGNADLK